MDLLDRLLGHDVWSTRQLLLQAQHLSDEQLDQTFDIDQRSLRACFEHLLDNMEVWQALMAGRTPSTEASKPEDMTIEAFLRRLSAVGQDFAALARRIASENRWDDVYTDVLDNPPTIKTYGGTIAHVITHSMHHRSQIMTMLEWLGVKEHIEGDALGWEMQAFGWK